jgi:hypothetical protein
MHWDNCDGNYIPETLPRTTEHDEVMLERMLDSMDEMNLVLMVFMRTIPEDVNAKLHKQREEGRVERTGG